MEIEINFDKPVINEIQVLEITTADLGDFYVSASEVDRPNLFFVLLTSLHYYEDNSDLVRAAHLSFLTAYYLFNPLTPPGSCLLALHYMKKAISLGDCPEYRDWLSIMEKGN